MLACGGVLVTCEFATCARGGAVTADGGAEGETGTELTWMTSSWKSVSGLELLALSTRAAVGSDIGGLIWGIGLLFGLVCLGARGGGGNN
jgi:hypothetical protein